MVKRASMGGAVRESRLWRAGRPATVLAVALVAAGCSSSTGPNDPDGAPAVIASSTPTPTPVEPTLSLPGSTKAVSYAKPVKISVVDGTLVSMVVGTKKGSGELDGQVSGDGLSWISSNPPKPDTAYRARASVKDELGQVMTKTVTFTAAKVPDDKRVSFTVTPDDGATVGIGQPVVVRFLTPISRKAAIEKAMHLDAVTPTGKSVTGSWHWLNSQQVDWRPKTFWTPGTKVTLDMRIAGVRASDQRYGRKDYREKFTIGASHITKVDAVSHRAKVYRDGKLVDTWLTGTGQRGLETYSGTYIVLNKSPVVQMDSCSARITCDKKDPDYYDEKEYWATRVTASGTFLHAADWDPVIGQANVSHGCIHLSGKNAENFYDHAVPGDVVIVTRSGRGPQERIATQDPGLYDWNVSWSRWKAGSAL